MTKVEVIMDLYDQYLTNGCISIKLSAGLAHDESISPINLSVVRKLIGVAYWHTVHSLWQDLPLCI